MFQDRSSARPHQLQSARPVAPPQVRENSPEILLLSCQPSLLEWCFVYFFFQHSLGLCHCDHLWWRVDLCSKRHPERAWQGCEADVLGQVRIVEHSQTRTLTHLPHQVPKWSESESGGGSTASRILRCEPFSCRQFIWTMSYQTSRPQMSRIRSVKG